LDLSVSFFTIFHLHYSISGDDKIHLDEYTSAIITRQQGRINILPTPLGKGVVQLTEGSFSDKYELVETVYR